MQIILADFVYPVSGAMIPDGAIAIEGSEIVDIGNSKSICNTYTNADIIQLGKSIVLPGLVNGHTHLDLSWAKGALPYQGAFTEWIRGVRDIRDELAESLEETISKAVRECVEHGVTCVGDISFQNISSALLSKEMIRKTCFAELFGISNDVTRVKDYLKSFKKGLRQEPLYQAGLSPHAPYSCGPKTYQLSSKMAYKYKLPITTHLAETADEIEFLEHGRGSFVDFLSSLNQWDGSFDVPGKRPVEYFLSLKQKDVNYLFAHVNYISDRELKLLAGTNHCVAYCPRSHHFFKHTDHRFLEMIEKGITVCLGTDSLASNETLSILDEMRFVYQQAGEKKNLKLAELLVRMGTINGAKALHWDQQIGTLKVGKQADIIAIPLTDKAGINPLTEVMESTQQPQFTMLAGKVLYHPSA